MADAARRAARADALVLRARARPPPRRLPRPRAHRGQENRCAGGHPGARRRARARWRGPRSHRSVRPCAAPDPRSDDEEALVLDAVADRGARRAGGHEPRGLRHLRAQRAVPRPTRPGAGLGRPARLPGAADRPPARRARAAPGGRGHRPHRSASPDARGSTPTASATCPAARSSPARTSSSANGRVRFTVRSAPAGIDVDGVELELRDGEVVSARAAVGDEYLQRALATDDGSRFLGEIGIGTNFGIAARRARSSSTRRSAAPSTSRSGARIPRRGARTAPRCTGTSSATCAPAGG